MKNIDFNKLKCIDVANEFGNNKQLFVYILVRDSLVIYVGMTGTLYNRISKHRTSKHFDKVYYIITENELDCSNLEDCLIYFLRPIDNFYLGNTKRMPYGKYSKFRKTWSEDQMKELIKKYIP